MPNTVTGTLEIVKAWGRTRRVFLGHGAEIWHASIVPGGYSSQHRHRKNFNQFYVVGGELLVHFYLAKGDQQPHRTCELHRGDQLVVNPMEWHRFEAVTGVELIETYWVSLGEEDIERYDVGGRTGVEVLQVHRDPPSNFEAA